MMWTKIWFSLTVIQNHDMFLFRMWLHNTISLWLSSLLFTQPAKEAKATSSFADPALPSKCVIRSLDAHTHHSKSSDLIVWLSVCVCHCHNTWVMRWCTGINNTCLISARENQKSCTSEKYVKLKKMDSTCRTGRGSFLKREVLRQLKVVVTQSLEVRFHAYSIIIDLTPYFNHNCADLLFWVSLVATPCRGKGLSGDSLEPQLFPSVLTCWASGYNMFT